MNLDEALTHAREMRFADKTEADLQQMLIVCGNNSGQRSDVYTANQIPPCCKNDS